VTLIQYDGQALSEKTLSDVEECAAYLHGPATTWVDVNGLRDAIALQRLLDVFDVPASALEDVLDGLQPPKLSDYGHALYFVIRRLQPRQEGTETGQINIFLGERFILTLHDSDVDPFESLRKRLRQGRHRIRNGGPDYLAYSCLDLVLNGYFPVLATYHSRIERLEDLATQEPTKTTARRIQSLKREVIHMRQLSWAVRVLLASLCQRDLGMITKDTRKHLRDVHEHAGRAEEMLESYRELCEGLYETHVSSLSLKTNDVMKVLTIISTLFLPLNFIASLYGMNFTDIPTIHGAHGFPIALAVMAAIACAMVVWFRRKRWI
jgi:magnesium transporter